jgi:cytidylate kinase
MSVITISRQFGAGGRTLGEMIAKKLGYTFADSMIIEMVAKEANVAPQWVEAVDKEAGNLKLKFISKMISQRWVDRVTAKGHGYIDDRIFLDYLVLIIAQLADEGDVVILGRGSQYILRGLPDAYHILLIDEFDNRVDFMMTHHGMTKDRAQEVVKHEDKRRRNFFRNVGKTDYDDPSLYNLVLNMDQLNLDQALDIVLTLMKKE